MLENYFVVFTAFVRNWDCPQKLQTYAKHVKYELLTE